MTITKEDELDGMKAIGRIVANTLKVMSNALEPGMTTRELDEIGREVLEREGALSAPKSTYDFPGTTCISVNEEIAHGIPGDRVIARGDLVNIDVSASKAGFFADTGATFRVSPVRASLTAFARMASGPCRSASRRSVMISRWPASGGPSGSSPPPAAIP